MPEGVSWNIGLTVRPSGIALISGAYLLAIAGPPGGVSLPFGLFGARIPQFFPNHPPDSGFEETFILFDILMKGFIDHSLIIPTTGYIRFISKPIKNFVIDPDGDSRFARRRGNYRADLSSLAEVIFGFHIPSLPFLWLYGPI